MRAIYNRLVLFCPRVIVGFGLAHFVFHFASMRPEDELRDKVRDKVAPGNFVRL